MENLKNNIQDVNKTDDSATELGGECLVTSSWLLGRVRKIIGRLGTFQ